MKYIDIKPPKSIGIDTDGFRAMKNFKRYNCYCPICNGNIVDFYRPEGPISDDDFYKVEVVCITGHIVDSDDVICKKL